MAGQAIHRYILQNSIWSLGMIKFNWLVNFVFYFEYNWDSLYAITITWLQYNLLGLTAASSCSYQLCFSDQFSLHPSDDGDRVGLQNVSWYEPCDMDDSLRKILLNSAAIKAPTQTSVLWLKDDGKACNFKKVTTCISGPGSSVGIVTGYRLDGPGIKPGGGEI
jgi:hypothetical protein